MDHDPDRARFDTGRITMVPAAASLLFVDLMVLAHPAVSGHDLLRWLGTLLTAAFYVMIIWCYMRRGRARATTSSVTARAAAVVATWTPFAIPQLHGTPPGVLGQGASDV